MPVTFTLDTKMGLPEHPVSPLSKSRNVTVPAGDAPPLRNAVSWIAPPGLIAGEAAATFRIESVGESATERLLSLVFLGDLVSIYLAVLRGVDPGPVAPIERLKSTLAGG